MTAEITALTELLSKQLLASAERENAAAERERRMAEMLDKALQSTLTAAQTLPPQQSQVAQQPSENRVTARPATMDRPMLVSSATSADLRAWEEAWQDFACCQHLSAKDRKTRASTLR